MQRFSGTNQKPELLQLFGTGPLKPCPQGLFFALLTFFRPKFFSPVLTFSRPHQLPLGLRGWMWSCACNFLFGSSMLAGYRFLKIINPSIKKQTVHLKVHFPFVSDKRKQAREILCNNNLEWEIECLNETNYEKYY